MKKIFAGFLSTLLAISCLTGCNQNNDGNNTTGNSSTANNNAQGNIQEVTLQKGDTYALISFEGFGDVTVKLFPEIAPVGVAHFIETANSGYYTGKTMHRIIADFMIQGGSLDGTGATDPNAKEFDVEASQNMRHFYGALCYANAAGKNGSQFYLVNNKKPNVYEDILAQKTDLTSTVEQLKTLYDQVLEMEKANEVDALTAQYYKSQYNYYSNLLSYLENEKDGVADKYKEVGGTPFLDGGYTVFGQTVGGFDVIDALSAVEVEASGEENSKPVNEIRIASVTVGTFEG